MRLEEARRLAGEVPDPELPVVTIADLGILRDVRERPGGGFEVTITPTYSGCPAMDAIRDDIRRVLPGATVTTVLSPPWSSDWITEEGRRKLAEAGIAPPGPAPRRSGPIPLTLTPPSSRAACPKCGSTDTEEIARFSATACKAMRRCRSCAEPFEHFKEL